MKIFVASNFREFAKERATVIQLIREMGHQPINMEDFGASEAAPIEVCMAAVQRADCIVVLLGQLYGTLVPDMERSFTQVEIECAIEKDIPILLYRSTNSPEINPNWPKAFQDLVELLLRSRTIASFDGQHSLRDFLSVDLARTFSENMGNSAKVFENASRTMQLGDFASARRLLFSAVADGRPRAYRGLAFLELMTNVSETSIADAVAMFSRAAASGDIPSSAAMRAVAACCPCWLELGD